MPVSHRGAISFGLVHIPIALYTATSENGVSFNQLHKACGQRIKYKKVCPHCNTEVGPGDIVKGFEFEKGRYVTMTEDDFEKIKTEKDKTIQILHFANIDEIDTIYFEKAYYAVPEGGGDQAFELLRTAMQHSGKVAIAKTVLGTKETLITLLPTLDGMLAETMFYADEIKALPKPYARRPVSEQELTMAHTLITSMTEPFDPALYHDEYQARLQAAIGQKVSGQEITETAPESTGNVASLMDALAASLRQQEGNAASQDEEKTEDDRELVNT